MVWPLGRIGSPDTFFMSNIYIYITQVLRLHSSSGKSRDLVKCESSRNPITFPLGHRFRTMFMPQCFDLNQSLCATIWCI
ncbi:Olfactory receptor [Echinococcus multilocularis]|uniref:Olfactory receptor n=1 Tax=Echinococcus multilocularis TaxID=6211 RepID=A0A0S4MNR3_ECHMU|nr:Olfactory receptor [Echinococcus multilocularis]